MRAFFKAPPLTKNPRSSDDNGKIIVLVVFLKSRGPIKRFVVVASWLWRGYYDGGFPPDGVVSKNQRLVNGIVVCPSSSPRSGGTRRGLERDVDASGASKGSGFSRWSTSRLVFRKNLHRVVVLLRFLAPSSSSLPSFLLRMRSQDWDALVVAPRRPRRRRKHILPFLQQHRYLSSHLYFPNPSSLFSL